MNYAELETPNGRELDLLSIIARIWERRAFLMGCMVIGALFGVYQLRTAEYLHSTKLTVIPAQGSTGSGAGSQLGGGLGALAALAGGASTQQVTPYTLYLKAISLRSVADTLAANPVIMRRLFRSQWNVQNQRWQQPESSFRSFTSFIRSALGLPPNVWQPPSGGDVQAYIASRVTVTTDPQSPVVVIEHFDTDPQFSVYFLRALNRAVDSVIRRQALERATANISYLSGQLERVTNTIHRQVLTETLSQQEQFRMMASSNVAYAADIFDGPVPSARPVVPRPLYLLLGSIIGGLLLGIPLALLFPNWHWLRGIHDLQARLFGRRGAF
jgi:hypothetical protein